MTTLANPVNINAISGEVLSAFATRHQIPPFSSRPGGLSLDDAYRVTPLLRAAFEARGEKVLGRKIGFTNRTMWPKYGVYAPIWGYITDATVHDLRAPSTSFRGVPQRVRPEAGPMGSEPGIQKQAPNSRMDSGSGAEPVPGRREAPLRGSRPGMTGVSTARVAAFLEPVLEPEIMFGLKAPPAPDMDEAALLDCIEWVSLGYEIAQTIFPGWKFATADTVAANGLHGALYVGERHAIAPRKAEWLRELSTFEAELSCNGKLRERGSGALVLDSPLLALRHLAGLLAKDPHNPPLAAGEIISTGSLTLAVPITPGETWTAKVSGIPLEEIGLRFE